MAIMSSWGFGRMGCLVLLCAALAAAQEPEFLAAPDTQVTILYIDAELVFDIAEILFAATAKQHASVKEKQFVVLVWTMLMSAFDSSIRASWDAETQRRFPGAWSAWA